MIDYLNVKCPTCGVARGQKCVTSSGAPAKSPHAARKGRAVEVANRPKPAKAKSQAAPQQKPITQTVMSEDKGEQVDTTKLFNHIALIVDASGSMGGLEHRTREVFNEQLETIKKNARETGQETRISVYRFGTKVSCIQHEMPPNMVQPFTRANYQANMGTTALMDAVGQAIGDGLKLPNAKDINHSYLIVAITDGYENASQRFDQHEIQRLIKDMHASDRWTFAFLVPRGNARNIVQVFGAYAGNVTEWDQTERGIQQAGIIISKGLGDYYQVRASGQRSSKSFFANLAQVSDQDLDNCVDISGDFFRWKVPHDMPIKQMVEERCAQDPRVRAKIHGFQAGRGYYQLTKSELVQEYKDFVIMDKKTGAVFGGDHARALAGIPLGARVRVRPGQFGDRELFILSTSQNRKLIGGTTFLYKNT